jgi:type IV pilus assembly protein PilW
VSRTRSRPRGVGLVEWLVALALGSFVAVAALSVYAQAASGTRTSDAVQQLHETARYAADLLERELRVAGYAGLAPDLGLVDGATRTGAPVPPTLVVAGCAAVAALDLARPVAAADGRFALDAATPLGCAPSPLNRARADSDTLTVRRARLEPGVPERGRLQVATTRGHGTLFADGNVPGPFADGEVHDLEASVYYVSADSSSGRGVPSLRRKRLVGGASGPRFEDEELAVGVEDLQLEFGVDSDDPDETPERHVPPGGEGAGDVPRTVRLWLVVRAETPDPAWRDTLTREYAGRRVVGTGDPYRRAVVERTVFLRNLRRQ